MRVSPISPRSGWTLIELSITVVLVSIVMAKAVFVMKSALGLASEETASMHFEDQARRVMDRIALAIMGADRGELVPQLEQVSHDTVQYRFSLGLENGEVVWSDPEQIRLDEARTGVEWLENPAQAEEKKVVWTKLVSPMLEGELPNGVDDNDNGLVDESGLSFVIEGDRVLIRLTLQRPEIGGRTVAETVESVVTCRN